MNEEINKRLQVGGLNQFGIYFINLAQDSMKSVLILLSLIVLSLSLGAKIKNANGTITVAIVGTNDIHGTVFPKQILNTLTGETYKYGGLVYMGRLIEILQKEFKNRLIYLDGGDQFQGGIESGPKVSNGSIMDDFYNTLGLNGSSIGNHEFDFGFDFLQNYLKNKNSPALAANLQSEKGQIDFLPNQKATQLYDLGGIKIGVIGLSTIESPTSTSGFVEKLFPAYKFLDYAPIVIEKSKALRAQGAHAVLIVSHVGNECPQNSTYDIRSNETQQGECEPDEVTKLIDSIPEGTIDGVVEGHRHRWVHHWYKNVPFMGVINGGTYFNVLYLNFDKKTKKVVRSFIEGPVPACEKVFSKTLDCSFKNEEALPKAGELTEWKFHNKKVYAHKGLEQKFSQWLPEMEQYFEKIVDTDILLERVRDKENPLGNLISTVLLNVAKSQGLKPDFSIINHGAFRSTWYPGTIQYQDFYAMFPFTGRVKSFDIKGSDLVEMLDRVQTGWDGFYYSDGLFETVSLTEKIVDGVKKQEKGFVNATLLDGTPIDPSKTYTGVTIEFLLKGGDDFVKAFKGYTDPVTGRVYTPLPTSNVKDLGEQRETFKAELQKLGKVTDQWKPNAEHPRLTVIQK